MSRRMRQRKRRAAKARRRVRRLARAELLAQVRDAEAMARALVDEFGSSEPVPGAFVAWLRMRGMAIAQRLAIAPDAARPSA